MPWLKNVNHFPYFSQKCRIWVFQFWHFSSIFVLSKMTYLVTLFDYNLQVFKNSPKWTIFGIFNELLSNLVTLFRSKTRQNWPVLAFLITFCPLKMWKCLNENETYFCHFQTLCFLLLWWNVLINVMVIIVLSYLGIMSRRTWRWQPLNKLCLSSPPTWEWTTLTFSITTIWLN